MRSLQTSLHNAGSAYLAEPALSYTMRKEREETDRSPIDWYALFPPPPPAGDGGMPVGINFIYSVVPPPLPPRGRGMSELSCSGASTTQIIDPTLSLINNLYLLSLVARPDAQHLSGGDVILGNVPGVIGNIC